MKRTTNKMFALALMAAAMVFTSCSQHDEIQSGDLLFVGIPADYSIADDTLGIEPHATEKAGINYIHTAILDVDEHGVWVIDATIKHGVDRHPLDTFLTDFTLKDGSKPLMEVYRLKDDRLLPKYVEATKKYMGEKYDVNFIHGNDTHYCTELVYDCYTDGDNHVFSIGPMDFRNADGEFPLYWQQLFSLINSHIPQDTLGITPQTMREEIIASPRFRKVQLSAQNPLNTTL